MLVDVKELNRRLREEQDAEYQRSLEADRERERKRTADRAEEEARQLAAQQAQDAERYASPNCYRAVPRTVRYCIWWPLLRLPSLRAASFILLEGAILCNRHGLECAAINCLMFGVMLLSPSFGPGTNHCVQQ